jgi:hypothetical protein
MRLCERTLSVSDFLDVAQEIQRLANLGSTVVKLGIILRIPEAIRNRKRRANDP